MRSLTRDEILSADDKVISDPIPMPEWGEDVYVRCRVISGTERDSFEAQQARLSKTDEYGFMGNTRARMVALFACDDEGAPLFTPEDALALGAKSAPALDRIFDVGREMNGWTKKDVKELEGKSEDVPSEGTGTA